MQANGSDSIDPDTGELTGWLRTGGELKEIPVMNGWISPRLKVRFELVDDDLQLYGPDNKKFATYVELVEQRERERQAREQAQQRADRLAAQLKSLGVEPAE